MTERALAVVDEFLAADDMGVARNAVVALSTLRSDESLDRLVGLSLGIGNRRLRSQALEALAELEGEGRENALARLHAALEDPYRKGAAYEVLGRLRERGVPVGRIRRPWRERWDLAGSLVAPRRKRTVMAEAALRAGTAGIAITVLVFLTLDHNPRLEGIMLLGLLALVLAVSTATLATSRAVPGNRYPDPVAAIAWEVTRAVRRWPFVALVAAVVGSLGLLLTGSSAQVTLPRLAAAGSALAIVSLAVCVLARAGTLLARGAVPRRVPNVWVQTLTGSALSWLVLTLLGLAALAVAGEDRGAQVGPIADLLWLLLIPVCAAVSHTFAMVDRRARREESLVPLWVARWACGGIGLVFSAALAFAVGRPHPLERGVSHMQGAELLLGSETLPASWGVQLTGPPDSMLIVAEAVDADTAGLSLALYYPPPSAQSLIGDAPARVEQVLKPGRYWIALSKAGRESAGAPRTPLIPRDLLRRLFLDLSGWSGSGTGDADGSPGYQVRVRRLPAEVAQERAQALALADSAYRLAQADLMVKAVEVLRLVADGPGRDLITAPVYDRMCWRGSHAGLAQDVVGYCNRAVRLDSLNVRFLDSRALARALSGDREGAISDYHDVLRRATGPQYREIRAVIVRKLEAGQSLTQADLRTLRQPYLPSASSLNAGRLQPGS